VEDYTRYRRLATPDIAQSAMETARLWQSAHLLCPISSNRGLPSPALLLGIRPVWYCGGNSWGGCSAFGRSCRKRSMVNCARGSSSDELADDFACACSSSAASAPLGIWREPSPGRGADGRRAMMRDSMRNSRCTGYSAEMKRVKKETSGSGRRSRKSRGLSVHLHLTRGIGAVKRSTLV
jgi:hypothetical protein